MTRTKTIGSGRKALDPNGESKPFQCRMTSEQRRRLAVLGTAFEGKGEAAWMRSMIDYCYMALPPEKR